MKLGPRTFGSHRTRIMKKYKARNAADLVRMAPQPEAALDAQKAEAAGGA